MTKNQMQNTKFLFVLICVVAITKEKRLKMSAVMTYTNSNTVAPESFTFRSKTMTKHGEMRNFFWLLYLNLCTVFDRSIMFHARKSKRNLFKFLLSYSAVLAMEYSAGMH